MGRLQRLDIFAQRRILISVMPAYVVRRGQRYRVVDGPKSNPRIVKNMAGTAVDGGGHKTKAAARRQARALNARMGR